MQVQPYLLGRGMAADALRKSLAILGLLNPELEILPTLQLNREQRLDQLQFDNKLSLLLIANPHGLHAEKLMEGARAGFHGIFVEKPACVSLKEIGALQEIKIPVAVGHVYRQMWGIQSLKEMLEERKLGDIVSIEGRYWQSSSAVAALEDTSASLSEGVLKKNSRAWKNDLHISGGYDAILDVGTHWVDAVCFLMGIPPVHGTAWLSYANSSSDHRDSHVHLNLEFSKNRRAMGSISKMVHGARNHFEINLLGTHKTATWTLLRPDEILLGEGLSERVVSRQRTHLGSFQSAFHGLGWLEGYIEILRKLIQELRGQSIGGYPELSENLKVLKSIFLLSGMNHDSK